jgi:hypothetical protein
VLRSWAPGELWGSLFLTSVVNTERTDRITQISSV